MKNSSLDQQFMGIALEVAKCSNCGRRKVGAVIVRDGRVIVEACNGTPAGMTPCNEGGCPRCLSETPQGQEYESCLCIHAEQAAIALAAQEGLKTVGATMYCTLRPCLTCVKLCLQAGIKQIIYYHDTEFLPDVEESYKQLVQQTGFTLIRCREEAKR